MGIITEIQGQRRRQDRVSVFVDGQYALALSRLSLLKNRLAVGQELSPQQMDRLRAEDALEEALAAAMRYLASRPRSERELRTRLHRRGIDGDLIDRVVENLHEKGLLDDHTFAQYWTEQRVTFRPRSRRLIERELVQKGVDRETIDQVTSDLDDEAEAYRAGLKKARALRLDDFQTFHKKLMTYLRGRGFGYTTSDATARGLWAEISHDEDREACPP